MSNMRKCVGFVRLRARLWAVAVLAAILVCPTLAFGALLLDIRAQGAADPHNVTIAAGGAVALDIYGLIDSTAANTGVSQVRLGFTSPGTLLGNLSNGVIDPGFDQSPQNGTAQAANVTANLPTTYRSGGAWPAGYPATGAAESTADNIWGGDPTASGDATKFLQGLCTSTKKMVTGTVGTGDYAGYTQVHLGTIQWTQTGGSGSTVIVPYTRSVTAAMQWYANNVIAFGSKPTGTDAFPASVGVWGTPMTITLAGGPITANTTRLWVGTTTDGHPTAAETTTVAAAVPDAKPLVGAPWSSTVNKDDTNSATATDNQTTAALTTGGAGTSGTIALATATPMNFAAGGTAAAPLTQAVAGKLTSYGGITQKVTVDNQATTSSGNARGSDNGNAVINVAANNVGKATVTGTSFVAGQELTANLGAGAVVGGLGKPNDQLKSTTATGVGNLRDPATQGVAQQVVGSEAIILSGTVGPQGLVSMNWRQRTAAEKTGGAVLPAGVGYLASDVVKVTGMSSTSNYVLQMNYMLDGTYTDAQEDALANDRLLGISKADSLTSATPNWAALTGTPVHAAWSGQMDLGTWGIDSLNNQVWLVTSGDGVFGVVPEPATISLLLAGGLGLVYLAGRRLSKKK
jgi:hypothetical protein